MSKVTVWFIKCAMIYFIIAALIGLDMAVSGHLYPYMQIHAHFNLLGWMSMMIFGVGYHILPRFSGNPLWSEKLSVWHLWLSNIGLVGMALGWMVGSKLLLGLFAAVTFLSMVFFVVNMFKTIRVAPALR